jgi:hypothetical protein
MRRTQPLRSFSSSVLVVGLGQGGLGRVLVRGSVVLVVGFDGCERDLVSGSQPGDDQHDQDQQQAGDEADSEQVVDTRIADHRLRGAVGRWRAGRHRPAERVGGAYRQPGQRRVQGHGGKDHGRQGAAAQGLFVVGRFTQGDADRIQGQDDHQRKVGPVDGPGDLAQSWKGAEVAFGGG